MQASTTATCPLCGGANACTRANDGVPEVECWCTKTTISPLALARLPAEWVNRACLCPRCAAGPSPAGTDGAQPEVPDCRSIDSARSKS